MSKGVTYALCANVSDSGDNAVSRAELVNLHKAIQRHCACRTFGPAVLEEACPSHLILRDSETVQRWVQVRRQVDAYRAAEFMTDRDR